MNGQPADHNAFDHFRFIKDYVNPLFTMNQQMINTYKVRSVSYNDYSLSNSCRSMFEKSLFTGQNTKGVYSLVKDKDILEEVKQTGRLLFYDPVLSGNNERSCASCHKPKQYFTDTTVATALQFSKAATLPRNTPTLINVVYNHLLMLDGRHISLQAQGKDVTTNPVEMGSKEEEIVKKVMSCSEYKKAFKKYLKYTTDEKEVTFAHIISAVTFYYSGFSAFYSPFDDAMNDNKPFDDESRRGFNLFMGKAKCATCHFVPHFNGVRPPYISTEFEVLGVPADSAYTKLSDDKGRYMVNPAPETFMAFRTGSLRNAQYTKPYMHNGVFTTLEQVIDFYNTGGGAGRKLDVRNQTLSPEPLNLTQAEKKELISFIRSLNENIIFQDPPAELPASAIRELNSRRVGGVY